MLLVHARRTSTNPRRRYDSAVCRWWISRLRSRQLQSSRVASSQVSAHATRSRRLDGTPRTMTVAAADDRAWHRIRASASTVAERDVPRLRVVRPRTSAHEGTSNPAVARRQKKCAAGHADGGR
jgi:hypothetical protein